MSAIYRANNYREFLKAELASPAQGRGSRSRLAEHLGVRLSYISIVLAGKQDFSPEHGMKIGNFLGLNAKETEHLILLIQWERAGSADLKRLYADQISRTQKERGRFTSYTSKETRALEEKELVEYYGYWDHITVHMCLRNPEFQSTQAISKRLGIEPARVLRSLALLEKIGFIQRRKDRYKLIDQHFHLGEKSTALRMHTINSRHAAIRSIDNENKDDLHYSIVVSADPEVREKIRNLLVDVINNSLPLIQNAKDELVFAINLDLFDV